MSVQLPVEFDDSYARAVPTLSVPWRAAEFPAPKLIQLNEELADELGIAAQALREPAGVALLVGRVPAEHKTYAQAYAVCPRRRRQGGRGTDAAGVSDR